MNLHQKKREQKRAARSLRSKQKRKQRRKALYKLLYGSQNQQEEEDQQNFPEVLDLGSGKDLTQAGNIIPKTKSFETQKGNK